MEEFLTPLEIAKVLRVSPEFVYKHARELGGVKIGRLVRFSKRIFNKKIEEVTNGGIQESRPMDVRLSEERNEAQAGRLPDERGGNRRPGPGKGICKEDKYGLREIVQESVRRLKAEEKQGTLGTQ